MKKYIQPTIEVTEIEAETLMAASATSSTGISDSPLSDPIDDANQILSRDHNFSIWGDDED